MRQPVRSERICRESVLSKRKRRPVPPKAHVGPRPEALPSLLTEVPLLIRIEREVEEEFRPQLRARIEERIRQEGEQQATLGAPRCEKCDRPMWSRGSSKTHFLTRFGKVELVDATYECKPCHQRVRPLLRRLGAEVGRISGSFARLAALLGIVVPYPLASQLVELFFGIKLSPMSVWRCVQRLGEASENYTMGLSEYHKSPHADVAMPADAPDAVVLGVDGCALGMQVRSKRRRREPGVELPPLPVVEEGHFREVKTGALLLPTERVQPSPERQSVVRRALVTCLGDADQIFDRLWSKLHQLAWLGANTVVVIVGDGAEWIWNRAAMFSRRCEILDFWHAVEKAWDFARAHFGEGAKRADTFVARIAKDLREGKVQEVLARLNKIEARTPEAAEALAALIKYYTDNAQRMRYDEYLRLGYGIGSGAVESAHKQVVHARMRQAGMRWSEAGARRLLALRLLLLNGAWSEIDRLSMVRFAA